MGRSRGIALSLALDLAVILGLALAGPASAEDFYKGRTVSLIISSPPGGTHDAYPRLVARHLSRFIPGGPTIVVRNMPGASGAIAAHYFAAEAVRDGTVMGAFDNTLPLNQRLTPAEAGYDAKSFDWIGAVASPANVLATWYTTGVKTLEDAQRVEVSVGATASTSTMAMYPLMTNSLFHTKFKVVSGYDSGPAITAAIERGEIQGRGGLYLPFNVSPEWLRDKKLNVLFQMTLKRDATLPEVPTLLEYAKTDEQRQIISLLAITEVIGRPLALPPAVPSDRVAILRRALAEMVKDQRFNSEAAAARLEISPISGEDLQAMVASVVDTPSEIVDKFQAAVQLRHY
jgi:tripartite-type tricarboxylate transporter receptor subunit TctC